MSAKIKKNPAGILCLWILVMLLCGCTGNAVSGGQTAGGEQETPSTGALTSGGMELPEGYTLLPGFEDAGRESEMREIHLVDNTLYYCILDWDQERKVRLTDIYRQERGKEACLLLSFGKGKEEGNWLENFAVGEDGSLYLLYSERKTSNEVEAYFLRKLDKDLKTLYLTDITTGVEKALDINDDAPGGIFAMETGADGCLYGMTFHGTAIFWDENGKYQESFSLNVGSQGGSRGLVNAGSSGVYSYWILSDSDDNPVVQLYDLDAWREMGEGKRRMAEPLFISKKTAPETEVSVYGTLDSFYVFGGREDGIYLADRNRLWRVDLAGGPLKELFAWEDISLKAGYVKEILRQEDGGFLLYIFDTLEKENYWVDLEPVPVSQIPQKVELVLGVAGQYLYHSSLTSVIDQVVLSYNRTHPECHITIKKYEENGVRNLQLELLKGEGPDILLERKTFFDMDNLLQKGAVEDLAPFLEEAEEMTAEEIVPGILEQITKEGKIPRIPLSFAVDIMLVPSDTPKEVMTPEELIALMTQNEQGYTDLFTWPGTFLRQLLLGGEIERYVDEENSRGSFDSEEFIRLLEALTVLNDREGLREQKEREERFREGQLTVIVEELNCMGDYLCIRDAFSDSVRITGFPNSSGELRYPAKLYDWLGINSASEHKKEAWSFIEFCLSYTSRSDLVEDRFAVTKDVFEQQTHYEKTEKHDYRYLWSDYSEDRTVLLEDVASVTQEETDFLRGIADHLYYYENDDLMQIIEEEAAAFYAGDIDAQEAAKRIQNRAALVLGE